MMQLTAGKTVTRKVQTTYRSRPLVVTLRPWHLEIRSLGSRSSYAASYESVLHLAAQLAADKRRAERKIAKKKSSRQ